MGLNIQLNYNSDTCKLEAKISDPTDRGKEGEVIIHISGTTPNQRLPFSNLTKEPQVLVFDVPKNGKFFKFNGTVSNAIDFGYHRISAQTCNP